MSALAHTVTPWECDGGDIWVDTRQQVCCGRGYSECCGEPDVVGGRELVATASPENAAFIIRAVNAHDDLVKALGDLYAVVWGECPSLLNEDSGGDASLDMRICELLSKAKEAQS